MTWPTDNINTSNIDAGTDQPKLARTDLNDLVVTTKNVLAEITAGNNPVTSITPTFINNSQVFSGTTQMRVSKPTAYISSPAGQSFQSDDTTPIVWWRVGRKDATSIRARNERQAEDSFSLGPTSTFTLTPPTTNSIVGGVKLDNGYASSINLSYLYNNENSGLTTINGSASSQYLTIYIAISSSFWQYRSIWVDVWYTFTLSSLSQLIANHASSDRWVYIELEADPIPLAGSNPIIEYNHGVPIHYNALDNTRIMSGAFTAFFPYTKPKGTSTVYTGRLMRMKLKLPAGTNMQYIYGIPHVGY